MRRSRLPGHWVEQAACLGVDPDLFFPERGDQLSGSKAREVCERCAVQRDCRDYALQVGEPFGIWGGLSEPERRCVRR